MIRFDLLILIALWLISFSDARKLHQYGKGESSFFFSTLNDAQLNGTPQQKTGDHWAQPSELSASASSAAYAAGHSKQSSRGHPAQPELSASASSASYAAGHSKQSSRGHPAQPELSASASSASYAAGHSKQSSRGHPAQPQEPRASASSASYAAGHSKQSSRGHPAQPQEPRASASIASYFAGPPRQSRSRGSRVLHCEQVDYSVCRIGLQESS